MYKITRTINGVITALAHNKGDNQYYFIGVDKEKVSLLSYIEAQNWKNHLSQIKKYANGKIRPRCAGVIQIINCEANYLD